MDKLFYYFLLCGALLSLFPFSVFSNNKKAAIQVLTLLQKERKLKSSLVIPYEVYVQNETTLLFYNNDIEPREVLIQISDGQGNLLFEMYATLTEEEPVSLPLPDGYTDFVITLGDDTHLFEAYYSK
ncbi:hypothetical protein [Parabacteroides sp. Marseille-P3160]|uniref:hypothetical protein n=1 Tax=Parabacteroides sp. Marseille-P3160 TaxID=1917887 RepID=UPI00111A0052|nr:hypothetical protein [Parabacteroides sp. Marseille-P3160]